MFEQKFKALILKFLGEFVEDFDDSSLKVDSWSGQVTQTSLNLRSGSLRFLSMVLGIDIKVVRGVIGTLQISFNWRTLWKEPIRLNLENLYIICKPSSHPDPSIFLNKRRNKKKARIEDMQLKAKLNNPNKTYLQQLEATIADNLCVTVKNVHIRYEDTISNQYRPFVIGLTLERLNYSPADSNWKRSFVTLEAKKLAQKSFMLLELSQFSVYHISKCSDLFSSKAEWLQSISYDKFANLMYPFIAHRDSLPSISEYYLLRPVNAEIRLRRSLKPPLESDVPRLSVSVLVEEMACALETSQYQDLLMLGSVMSLHKTVGVYINLRPTLRPKARTRDWWVYVLSRIKETNQRKFFPKTFQYLAFRKKNKLEYIAIYQHILVKEYESEYGRSIGNFQKLSRLSSLSVKELENELTLIEDSHTVDEIFLFRCVAERELSAVKDTKKKGWLQWGRGWFSSTNVQEENFLKSLVEYSELIMNDQDVSTKYTKSFLYFYLNKCSISLDGRHLNGARVSHLKISLYQATVHRAITPSTTKVFAALSSLSIIDPFTPVDKFRKLFSPKFIDESFFEGSPSFEIEEEIFPEENDGFPEFASMDLKQEPLFKLKFNSGIDEEMSLEATLQPLEIVYNRFCNERITEFLKIPEALALYESIEIQTMNQLSKWKLRTQTRLGLLMKNQVNLSIDVTISAPLIVIPENTMNEDTSQINLNTGDLRITSRPQPFTRASLVGRRASDIDESAYYDNFDIEITDISVALVPHDGSVPENIIEKFNIKMLASKSVIPKDPGLCTLKVSGEIEGLTARLSKVQYFLLRQYSSNEPHVVEENIVEYKPPANVAEEFEDEEFFDATDPYEEIISEAVSFPADKEHFRADFAIKHMNLTIMDDSNEKEQLTLTAKDLFLVLINEEARRQIGMKLGYILLKDWTENREIVHSNTDTSELICIEYTKVFENHPDFSFKPFQTDMLILISNLNLNYYNGKLHSELSRFMTESFHLPNQSLPKINSSMQTKFILKNVSCKLSDGPCDISELNLQAAEVCVDSSDNFKCELRQVTVKDFLHNILFFETLDSAVLLQVEVSTCGVERSLSCEVRAFKMIMATGLILRLNELYQGSVFKALSRGRSSVSSPFTRIMLKVDHPLFEFLSSSVLHSTCDVNLGALQFSKDSEVCSLHMADSSVYTLVTHEQELFKETLLSNFSIQLSAELPRVHCTIPDLSMSTSIEQLKFVQRVFLDYSDKLLSAKKENKVKREYPEEDAEGVNVVETLVHGVSNENEKLNLELSVERASLVWFSKMYVESELKMVKIEAYFAEASVSLVKKASTTWAKLLLDSVMIQYETSITSQTLFSLDHEMLMVGLQMLPHKYVVDLNFNSLRLVVTPFVLQILVNLKQELSFFSIKTSKKRPIQLSGDFRNCQVILSLDSQISFDEENVQYTSEYENKRFCMIKASGGFQSSSASCSEFSIVIGKATRFTDEVFGKHLLHPLKFEFSYEDSAKITLDEINLDFSLSQIHFFRELIEKFKLPQRGESEKLHYRRFQFSLKVQQVLLSLSHDSTVSGNSTYLMVQLDYPVLSLSKTLSFSTSMCVFYNNQQYIDWEPLLEQSDLAVDYSFSGKPKRLAITFSNQTNINISSAFISTMSNFWTGIQDYDILETSSPAHKFVSRIHSGFAIRNETGHRIKYYIDSRSHTLANMEEQGLEFEEFEEEIQLAPVVMFKSKMKAKKAYRVKKINVKIHDITKINEICVDKLGSKVYGFSYKGSHHQVICEVTSRQGDNLLTIRSPILVKNMLGEPIDLILIYPFAQNRASENYYSSPIPLLPLSTVPLPIEFLGFTEFMLKIKGFSWSLKKNINISEPVIVECEQKPINSSERLSFRKDVHDQHRIAMTVLRLSQDEVKDENEKFYMKIFTFEPPFVMENCLCCDLEYFCNVESSELKPHGLLQRGGVYTSLEIPPTANLSVALRIPGYDRTNYLDVIEDHKQIFQFSKRHSEQVNIVLEASTKEGMLKIVLFSQYWLENHTSLPLLFKYMENDQNYDTLSLPYIVEGVYLEERQNGKKKGEISSMFAAFGEKLNVEEEPKKPWLRYTETKKVGLSCLFEEEEFVDEGQGTIRMFSSDMNNPLHGTVSIKLANSIWSKNFKLTGKEGKKDLLANSEPSIKAIEDSPNKRKCVYEVAMTMSIAEQPYSRTKIIRFAPRFVIINKLPIPLLISQFEPDADFASVCRFVPNERSAFHWPDNQKDRSLCVKLDSFGWQWSGRFYIECPDDFIIRLRNSHSHEETLAHITITLEENTLHVIFSDISHLPPYRIENLSMETLTIQQIGTRVPEKLLQPFQVVGYAWDEPLCKKVLNVSINTAGSPMRLDKFKFDKQRENKTFELKPHGSHPAHPLYVEVTTSGSTKVLIIRHDLKEEDDIKNSRIASTEDAVIDIYVDCIGFSIINLTPEEIIFGSFSEVRLSLERNAAEITADFSVKSGQIDNQLYQAINPIFLNTLDKDSMLLRVKFKKRHNLYSVQEVDYYKYLKVMIAPVEVRIDGWILEKIIEFVRNAVEVIASLPFKHMLSREGEGEKKTPQQYYFDKLLISSVNLNISFISMPYMYKSKEIVNSLGMLFIIFGNIGNFLLNFHQLKLEHRHFNVNRLKRELSSFYINQCKNQIISILASSDVLGNPNELLSHLRMGLIDLLTLSGEFSVKGLFKGMTSFFHHSIFGASNSMYKLFESFKNGMNTMILNENKERSFISNLFMSSFRMGLLIPNLAVSVASSTANNIRDAVQQPHALKRKRPPRCFTASSVLSVYSYSDSVGQYVLSMVEYGKYLSEGIKFHINIKDLVVVVTSKRVLNAQVEEFKAKWQILIENITLIKITEDKLQIFYVVDDIGFKQNTIELLGGPDELQRLQSALAGIRN